MSPSFHYRIGNIEMMIEAPDRISADKMYELEILKIGIVERCPECKELIPSEILRLQEMCAVCIEPYRQYEREEKALNSRRYQNC